MPRVPGALSFDTNMIPLRFEGPSASMAAIPGQQMQQTGQAMMSLGGAALDIATEMQRDVNRTQVIAAQNKAMAARQALTFGAGDGQDAGYLSFRGEAALAQDGRALDAVYTEKMQSSLAEIEAGLGNDAQRAAFNVWRGGFESEFRGQVQRHQLEEYQRHKGSVLTGQINLGIDAAAKAWAEGDKVKDIIDGTPAVPGDPTAPRYGGVRQAAFELAKLQGKSATETEYDVRHAVSKVHMGVVVEALANQDPATAHRYLMAHKGDMLESDVLQVNDKVQRHVDAAIAQRAVVATDRELANQFQPTDMDRLTGIVRGIESNGRDYGTDGAPLTSAKGARYSMQVMPATAANPGFGIKPAADDSPAEYNRVGRELLGALVKKYGSLPEVLAAYNAGSGAVDAAKEKAKASGGNWMAELPAETQDYVRKGRDRFAAGMGAPTMPTELEYVNAAVSRLGVDASPEAVKLAQSAAEHQYGLRMKAIKEQGEKAEADAMRWLDANGGRYSELPDNLRAAVPPDKWDNLRTYGARVAKGDGVTNWGLYNRLLHNPAQLGALTEDNLYKLRTELAEPEYKEIAKEWANLRNGQGGANGPGELNTSAINSVLADRLRAMGRDPTPKDGSNDAKLTGEMHKFVRESIANEQLVTGKKLNDVQVEQHIDRLFAQSVGFQRTFLGINVGGPTTQNMMGMKPGDIPGDTRDKIVAALKARGYADPSDEQVLGTYWRISMAGRK